MKTFTEALELVAPSCDSSDHAKARELGAAVLERAARLDPVVREVQADKRLKVLLHAATANSCCVHHALLNVFILGLHTGMEMEMAETGGVDLVGEPPER